MRTCSGYKKYRLLDYDDNLAQRAAIRESFELKVLNQAVSVPFCIEHGIDRHFVTSAQKQGPTMMNALLSLLIVFAVCVNSLYAFRNVANLHPNRWLSTALSSSVVSQDGAETVGLDIPLGDGFQVIKCQFRPIFEKSEFFTVTYGVPFGLNVDKPAKGFPAPVVTKDSKEANGEKKGDVLRATTCWSQGFSAAGATSDIAMFAGNIKWRKSLFDTTGAPWDETVKALVSNTAERSKEVTLVFERQVDGDAAEEASA